VARNFGHDRMFDLLMKRSPADVQLLTAAWIGDEALLDALRTVHPSVQIPAEEYRNLPDAARNNDVAAVKLLLKLGLPVEATGQHNGTTLHWAAWNGNVAAVEEILRHDPPLEARDRDFDGTPLNWAIHASVHGWHPDQVDYAPTVEALLKAGAKRPTEYGASESVRRVLEAGSAG
jgi:hypothetical protein